MLAFRYRRYSLYYNIVRMKVSNWIPFLTIFLTFRASFGEKVVNPKSPIKCISEKACTRQGGWGKSLYDLYDVIHSYTVCAIKNRQWYWRPRRPHFRTGRTPLMCLEHTHTQYLYIYTHVLHAYTPQTNTRHRFRPRSLFFTYLPI